MGLVELSRAINDKLSGPKPTSKDKGIERKPKPTSKDKGIERKLEFATAGGSFITNETIDGQRVRVIHVNGKRKGYIPNNLMFEGTANSTSTMVSPVSSLAGVIPLMIGIILVVAVAIPVTTQIVTQMNTTMLVSNSTTQTNVVHSSGTVTYIDPDTNQQVVITLDEAKRRGWISESSWAWWNDSGTIKNNSTANNSSACWGTFSTD